VVKEGCAELRGLAGQMRARLKGLREVVGSLAVSETSLKLMALTTAINELEANAVMTFPGECSGTGRRAAAGLPTSGPRLAVARVHHGAGKMAQANDHTLEEVEA
jgi:hypothetical protein